MKLLKSYQHLLLLAGIAVVGLGSFLYWHYTPYIIQAFKVSWLFLGIVIAIIATPLGNRRLAASQSEAPQLPGLSWLTQIILIELSLFALFWGICQLNGVLMPILTTGEKNLFVNGLQETLLHMGLFPWCLFALLAVGFAHTAYAKQRDAYTCSLMSPFATLSPSHVSGMIFDTCSRIVTLIVLASTLTFIALLLATTLSHSGTLNLTGFRASGITASFIIMLIIISKRLKKGIHFLMGKQKLPASLMVYLFLAAITLVCVVLGIMLYNMSDAAVATPAAISSLLQKGWLINWHIFIVMWWWAWASVIALFLARISKGRSVRTTLIAILLLPGLITALVYLLKQHLISLPVIDSPILIALGSTLGFVYLTAVITRHRTFGILSQLYLPASRTVKKRHPEGFTQRWLRCSSITFYFYLPAGIIGLGLFFFLATVSYSLLSLPLALGLLKGLRRN